MKYTPVDTALYQPCEKAGSLQRVWYDTETYDDTHAPLRKDALVYLPYGYEQETGRAYPVLYLMHGGGGDANEIFGGEEAKTPLKNLLDNMIASGAVEPLIVITPSYVVPGDDTVHRYMESACKHTHRFPKELTGDLLGFIDRSFRTIPDRQHRAFGGFSMGAETTWSVLCDAVQEVGWYLPLSGDYWAMGVKATKEYPVETVDALLKKVEACGITPGDYHIIACTGDKDIAYEPMDPMVKEMARRAPWFTFGETPAEGNLCYLLKPDGWHTYDDCYEYIWHALPWLFQA